MEQSDRARIDFCCDSVTSRIDMTKLWPKLLEHRVYNRDDCNVPRWTKNLTAPSIVRDIYLTIKTRGPKAFKNLLLSLRQTGHREAADILEGKNDDDWEDDWSCHHDVQRSTEPLRIRLRKATEFLDGPVYDVVQRYPMRSKPRGLVLIITNIHYEKEPPRISAEHDEINLRELFEQMGFEVLTKRDLTGNAMREVVRDFSKRDDLKRVDSCFVIITSHGTQDEKGSTEIQGIDYMHASMDKQGNYQKILCQDVMNYFTAEACPHLAEKPKIFIFQLCRGDRKQNAILHSRLRTDTCAFYGNIRENQHCDDKMFANRATRNNADMLVVQSTLPGHVAYRDSINGSWFIQILCKVFMKYAYKMHLQDLFNKIDAELKLQKTVDNHCQTSSTTSVGFNKHCYLNPGFFGDHYQARRH